MAETYRNGESTSGGGGAGGAAVPQAWSIAYEVDLASVADDDLLSGGDGVKTIDGKDWELVNVANATAVDVGPSSSGLRIQANPVGAYSFMHGGSPRTATMMRVPLRELLRDSAGENRHDIEVRVSYLVEPAGGPSAYQFEGFVHGLDPKNNTTQGSCALIWSGWWDNNPTQMRAILLGTDAGGPTEQTNADIAVFPNAQRLTFVDGRLRRTERNDNNTDTDLDAVTWTPVRWALAAVSELFSLVEDAANEVMLLMALDNYAGGGAFTGITMKKLRVEFRAALTASTLWIA